MSRRGSSLVDALVGAALAGVALALLAATAGLATHGLRLARDTSVGLALARERLDMLRAGPRTNGSDMPISAEGTRFTRTWRIEGGRGQPVRLSVRVAWGRRAVALATEAMP